MQREIFKALVNIAYNGPTGVVVSSDGETKPPLKAKEEDDIGPDIIFIRDDGWSLGAPAVFEEIADGMCTSDWVCVIHKPFPKMDNQERLVIKGKE